MSLVGPVVAGQAICPRLCSLGQLGVEQVPFNDSSNVPEAAQETFYHVDDSVPYTSSHSKKREVQKVVTSAHGTDSLVMDGVMKHHETVDGPLESNLQELENN